MPGNEVNEGKDKVERFDRSDRTSENTSKDSIIGGERKEHQEIHQEASKAGKTFETFSDNNEDQSFKAIQPTTESFGIDFGDGTVETAKGIISKPKTQDPFEQKGQEILKAAQKLKPASTESISLGGQNYEPDQLLAAKITPTNPVRTDATLPNPNKVSDHSFPDDATAQLPDLEKMVKDAGDTLFHPHKNEPNKFLEVDAAKLAINKFPLLSRYARNNATIGARLILGIVRNETEHYKRGVDDAAQDGMVYLDQKPISLNDNPTIGPAQISLKNQMLLVKKYSEILGDPKDYPNASLSPYIATLLVGAYLDNTIETFEKWDEKPPSEEDLKDKTTRLLYEHAYPKWREGHYTEALIRSYNPGDGSRHVKNVQRHIDALNKLNKKD